MNWQNLTDRFYFDDDASICNLIQHKFAQGFAVLRHHDTFLTLDCYAMQRQFPIHRLIINFFGMPRSKLVMHGKCCLHDPI